MWESDSHVLHADVGKLQLLSVPPTDTFTNSAVGSQDGRAFGFFSFDYFLVDVSVHLTYDVAVRFLMFED